MATKKRKGQTPNSIDPRTVKVRKRIAPGTRIIKSDKDKERKHKRNFIEDCDDEHGY